MEASLEKAQSRDKNNLNSLTGLSHSLACSGAAGACLVSVGETRYASATRVLRSKPIMLLQASVQRSLLASRSDSSRARMAPFLTGPFTFLTRVLFCVPMKLTLTCVIPPLEPSQKLDVRTGSLTSFADDFIDGSVNDFSRVHICLSSLGNN